MSEMDNALVRLDDEFDAAFEAVESLEWAVKAAYDQTTGGDGEGWDALGGLVATVERLRAELGAAVPKEVKTAISAAQENIDHLGDMADAANY